MICEVDNLPVYYESFGAGRPVVFLPVWGNANGECREIHEPVFRDRPGWRRIYVDPPGTGRTPSRPWIKDQDGMLAVLRRVVDQVVGDGNFAIAGTSAGGYHARGIVRRNPSRVEGLLLRVPGVIVDRVRRTVPSYRPLVVDPAFSPAEDPQPVVQTADYVAAHREKFRRFYDPAEEQAELDFLGSISGDPSRYAFSFDPAVRCEAPTLIVTGRQDTMVGYVDAWALLDDYPRATFAVLDRADHSLPIQQERLYHALVADWLDRVEETAGASTTQPEPGRPDAG